MTGVQTCALPISVCSLLRLAFFTQHKPRDPARHSGVTTASVSSLLPGAPVRTHQGAATHPPQDTRPLSRFRLLQVREHWCTRFVDTGSTCRVCSEPAKLSPGRLHVFPLPPQGVRFASPAASQMRFRSCFTQIRVQVHAQTWDPVSSRPHHVCSCHYFE